MSIEQDFWNYFLERGLTPESIAGIMGNIYKESKFKTNNLQDDFNKSLRVTDEQYTIGVDNGYYQNFINDGAGYGLVQWTYGPFKQDLLNLCKSKRKSIADKQCQFDLLYVHLQSENLLNQLKNIDNIATATEFFMKRFEKPTDQSQKELEERIKYSQNYYQQFNKKQNKNGGVIGMKYNIKNPPLVCMQTNSTCYQNTNKMAVKGVLWHSTGANNKTLKRYIQPSENDPNYNELIFKIGKNPNGNDWNHISMQAGLNAWIGTLADGTVAAVQTMPWDYKPWGCGSGSRGSCNNGWIQFEICEDTLADGNYFMKVYQEACELTAYLCKVYNIDPLSSTSINGIAIPNILCHQDSYQLGFGTNHSDVYHWFTKYGKTMNDVRNDVAKLLGNMNNYSSNTNNDINNNPVQLKIGSQGSEVAEIQKALIKLGYNLGTDGADGEFGVVTEKALKTFQQKHNLTPDGIFDTQTFLAMKEELKNNPPVSDKEIYRVRKSWLDVSSQIGAYENLNYAKATVDKLGNMYHVYNSKGQEIYPLVTTSNTINQQSNAQANISHLQPAHVYSSVKLASSSKDENGRYTGGQKGDQTGQEVHIVNWYNSGWNYILRPKDYNLAEKIARAAEAGCANDNIGYSQGARNTLYIEAQKVGLDLSKITTPCDCDCSSFVSICCICAGLSPSIFYEGGNMRTTYNMRQACETTGQFLILTGNQYTAQSGYLKRGDILLNSNSHVTIVLQDGPNAAPSVYLNPESVASNIVDSYKIRVMVQKLNVRKEADSQSPIVGQVSYNQIYTIVEEKGGFGRLKSGVGWLNLSYTQKI